MISFTSERDPKIEGCEVDAFNVLNPHFKCFNPREGASNILVVCQ